MKRFGLNAEMNREALSLDSSIDLLAEDSMSGRESLKMVNLKEWMKFLGGARGTPL